MGLHDLAPRLAAERRAGAEGLLHRRHLLPSERGKEPDDGLFDELIIGVGVGTHATPHFLWSLQIPLIDLWSPKYNSRSTNSFIPGKGSSTISENLPTFGQIDESGETKDCWPSAAARLQFSQNARVPYLSEQPLGRFLVNPVLPVQLLR